MYVPYVHVHKIKGYVRTSCQFQTEQVMDSSFKCAPARLTLLASYLCPGPKPPTIYVWVVDVYVHTSVVVIMLFPCWSWLVLSHIQQTVAGVRSSQPTSRSSALGTSKQQSCCAEKLVTLSCLHVCCAGCKKMMLYNVPCLTSMAGVTHAWATLQHQI